LFVVTCNSCDTFLSPFCFVVYGKYNPFPLSFFSILSSPNNHLHWPFPPIRLSL
jgi:hypothetical protein